VVSQVVSTSSGKLPIFEEAPQDLRGLLSFQIESQHYLTKMPSPFAFGYRLQSPGFDDVKWGYLNVLNGYLEIEI